MAEIPYGLDALLRGRVPRLVGLDYTGDRRIGFDYPRGGPVIRLVGGRGVGKTALLRNLSEVYAQRLPLAYADLAAPDFADPAPFATETANASRVTDLLYLLSYELGLQIRDFPGRLRFPRLTQGLLAVTSWRSSDPDDPGSRHGLGSPHGSGSPHGPDSTGSQEDVRPPELVAAEMRLGDLLRARQPNRQQRLEVVRTFIEAVAQRIGASVGIPPPLDAIVPAVIDVIAVELLSPRAHRGALAWWGGRNVAPGNGLQQLVALAKRFRRGGEDRQRAQRQLVAALLEDLADHYGWWQTANRVPRPLVLLDNAHCSLGREFVPLLLDAHHEAARAGRPTRLVVVAAALGDGTAHRARNGLFSSPDGQHPVQSTTPEDWLLELGIPLLELDDIQDMVDKADLDPLPDLARLILRLSGGRTSIARALALAAVRRMRTDGGLRPEQLLDLPAAGHREPPTVRDPQRDPGPEPTTVTAYLLEHLVPHADSRHRLMYYSPALDDAAAHRLAPTFPPGDTSDVPVQDAKHHLRQNFWPHRPWPGMSGPFVGDRTLRTLLLHRLRGRHDEPSDDVWTQIHRRLRHHYDPQDLGPGSAPHDNRYLHHSLALGESDVVVRSLHLLFTEGDAGTWLAAVNLVCAAPHPPPVPAPPSADTMSCPACLSGGRLVHQAIDRLVQGLWRLSAPLAVPDGAAIRKVEFELRTLAQYSEATAQEFFFRAHIEWPERLRRWVQAPDLPTPGGGA